MQPLTVSATEPTKGRRCWECRRRRVVCDFSIPECNKCRAAGVECPGYDAKKPLRWLDPGRVSSRTRKKKVAVAQQKNEGESTDDQDKQPVSADDQLQVRASNVPRVQLVDKTGTIVQAVYYYNCHILPEYTPLLQLGENPFIMAFPMSGVQYLPPAIHNTLVSMALGHRFHQLLPQNSRSDLCELRTRYFHHRGEAIRSVGEAIAMPEACCTDLALNGVMMLLFTDSRQSTSPDWRHHFACAMKLVAYRGGVENLLQSAPHLRPMLLYFMIIGVVSNTTTPPSDHILASADTGSIKDISQLYGDGFFPILLCPPTLFKHIIRINHLRRQAFSSPCSPEHLQPAATDLLGQITAFLPEDWATSTSAPDEAILLGHLYRCAVTLYCLLSLQSLSLFPHSAQIRAMKRVHAANLTQHLRLACASPGIDKCMLWPLFVAGMAADGDLAICGFIEKRLTALAAGVGSPIPLLATVVLKRAWESGGVGWDECFERPYCFVV
ncbi:C6 zinc finger domain protein [Aspergillus clavatus NRRL 1]|uniref:C6 zinc finger domain protein n=1 Tax=Aspergillus clavatus (strain ATCC 1007 / CBS 513.65 / DSM 816 / NCTC 3887 / NRRL 1 / QM 1276 / 107) TaxID=344612 RepID=A1C4B3_ASPCL|nr:C6 zinc finger domain protein [Aspergillus clavatus NRRL 1]EAW15253.1 C6 zinc finger domain protein [Aspergillus clavatus NRRL 1]